MAEPEMGAPVNPWMMETGSIVIWSVLALVTIVLTVRNRRLPLIGLCLIAATSSFWQEFFGDWGAYVAWNPAFARLPFWGEMAYTTPVKPLFIPFSWGWWFAATLPALTALVAWLRRRLAGVPAGLLAFLVVFPLFLAYQLYAEGSAVANGWWTYDITLGPALESPKGRLPIIFPVCLGLWAAFFVAMLAKRDSGGFWPHERMVGGDLAAMSPLKRELTRLWAMILFFQISFFVFNTAPPIIGRLLFGGPSVLVP